MMKDMKSALDIRFTYHPPFGDQPERYAEMRSAAKALAEHIVKNTPASREQSVALTKLDEVVFWANAAIARNEDGLPDPEPRTAAGSLD